MLISIDELLTVRSTVERELIKLLRDYAAGAVVETVNDIETENVPVEKFEETESKLIELQNYLMMLNDLLQYKNTHTTVEYELEGEKKSFSLAQAIERTKWLRRLGATQSTLGSKRPTAVTVYNNEQRVTKVLHDIEAYADISKETVKEANILSRAITRISSTEVVDVPGAEDYL